MLLRRRSRLTAAFLLLVVACEPSPQDRARRLFPDRSRTLATERPFRIPAGAPASRPLGTCPKVLEDVATGTSVNLRSWAQVEERRSEGKSVMVTQWQKGYYVPSDPAAVGLAKGEAYTVRCDRLVATGVNVPDVQPGT
jgi:hypothetical protein